MSLFHQFRAAVTFANLLPFIQIHVYKSLEQLHKAPVKNDFLMTILFKQFVIFNI